MHASWMPAEFDGAEELAQHARAHGSQASFPAQACPEGMVPCAWTIANGPSTELDESAGRNPYTSPLLVQPPGMACGPGLTRKASFSGTLKPDFGKSKLTPIVPTS